MEKVKKRQRLLNFLSDAEGRFYYDGPIDGKDGPKTQEGAERFLRDYGFTAEAAPDKNVGSKSDFWSEIEFFSRDEFRCKCGKCGGFPVEPDKNLIDVLVKIRKHFGKPVYVNSGIRCATHNANVGGATASQHLKGTAADITVDGVEASRVAMCAETMLPKTGGIGRYKTFTHVDVRSAKARWNG